jgi:hypothetical protein
MRKHDKVDPPDMVKLLAEKIHNRYYGDFCRGKSS